jgi:hypothetical protein
MENKKIRSTKNKVINNKDDSYSEPKQHKLCKDERETHLYIDEIDNCWIADVTIQRDINKFTKQGWAIKSKHCYADGSIHAIVFTAPRSAISIGKANRSKRNLTEEQREKISNRLKESRNKNKNKNMNEI